MTVGNQDRSFRSLKCLTVWSPFPILFGKNRNEQKKQETEIKAKKEKEIKA